jgi:hypothetical protein
VDSFSRCGIVVYSNFSSSKHRFGRAASTDRIPLIDIPVDAASPRIHSNRPMLDQPQHPSFLADSTTVPNVLPTQLESGK